MLKALNPEQAREIADLSERWHRDQAAMTEYLDIGKQTGLERIFTPGDLDAAAKMGAFDAPEERALRAVVASLPPQARVELIALMQFGRGDRDDFAAALRHARSIAGDGAIDYVCGEGPLAEYLRARLKKLGLA